MQRMCRRIFGFAVYHASFFYYLIFLPFLDPRETDERFRIRLRKAIRIALWTYGVKLVVEGKENLNRDRNAIIVANHSSWFDQLALVVTLDRPITFMANQKYFKIWGLSRILRKLECVPVHTGSDADGCSAAKSLSLGRQLLERGKWLVVYPEGTRSAELLPFRRGAAILAHQTGLPTQSIVIHGAQEVLPRMKNLFEVRPGKIRLEIQPPVYKVTTDSATDFIARIEHEFASVAQPSAQTPGMAETPGMEQTESSVGAFVSAGRTLDQ